MITLITKCTHVASAQSRVSGNPPASDHFGPATLRTRNFVILRFQCQPKKSFFWKSEAYFSDHSLVFF